MTEETFGSIKKIKYEWTSAADGTASATTTNIYNGQILRLVTIPDGTAAPTDNYDVVINDADGVDALNAKGADRDTADTEQVVADLGCVANDKLTFSISNAGDTKKGTVILYLR